MTNYKSYIPIALIALPLLAYAFMGTSYGSYFANVASAQYGADKVTVCRPTGSDVKPYVKVTVPEHVAERFIERGGTYPDSDGECPDSSNEEVEENIDERIEEHKDKQAENRANR